MQRPSRMDVKKEMCIRDSSNTAFVGYPILRALYGDFAVFVFSLMHLPFNILIFTYGRALLQQGMHKKITMKDLLSIGTVSSIIALVIYFGNITLPDPVSYTHLVKFAMMPCSLPWLPLLPQA